MVQLSSTPVVELTKTRSFSSSRVQVIPISCDSVIAYSYASNTGEGISGPARDNYFGPRSRTRRREIDHIAGKSRRCCCERSTCEYNVELSIRTWCTSIGGARYRSRTSLRRLCKDRGSESLSGKVRAGMLLEMPLQIWQKVLKKAAVKSKYKVLPVVVASSLIKTS